MISKHWDVSAAGSLFHAYSHGIFGRYDKPKMMPIAVAAFGKCPVIGAVMFGIEHAAGSIVLGDALPA